MKDTIPTTGRPLNTSDAPGKADSEMGIDQSQEPPRRRKRSGKREVAIDPDDALIDEPKDHLFED
jgi:hypothetical protein